MKRIIYLFSILLVNIGFMLAQNRQVTGIVVDDSGKPVIGASVIVKGTSTGTVTDLNGNFSLTISEGNQTLEISYIGMLPQTVQATSNMRITLTYEDKSLEEVIVVAYGTAKKSSFTGSAELIKSEQIERRTISNITKALDGVVSGLQSTSGGGQPGSSASLSIRGIGSINASSTPLYVIDGAPYEGDLNAINPNDIESISILKDASSAALYGARGANGVVMITTKRGKAGRTYVNLKAVWGGISRAVPRYETVNQAEYMELAWEAIRNSFVNDGKSMEDAINLTNQNYMDYLGGEIYNPFSIHSSELINPLTGKISPSARSKYEDNWLDEADRENPFRQEYTLSISGGNEKNDYLISLGYLDEKGLLKNSDFERISGRLNVNSNFTNWLKGGMSTAFSQTKQRSIYGEGSAYSNVWFTALNTAPIYPVYIRNTDGSLALDSDEKRQFDYGTTRPFASDFNTIATLEDDRQSNVIDNFSTRVFAEIADQKNPNIGILKDFKLQVNFSADYKNMNEMLYWNPYFGNAANYNGLLSKENSRLFSSTFNQLLFYENSFGEHSVDFMVGHEFFSRKFNSLTAARQTFPWGGIYDLTAGASLSEADSRTDRYYVESYLSRINYNYGSKYYFSGSIRTDGSSRFHKDNRWGTFWSLGTSWRISEEDFLDGATLIDNLTIKASYGYQGNDAIDSYYGWAGYYDLAYPNGDLPGSFPYSEENKDLKWEKSRNINVGVEGSFFNQRLRSTVEFYIKKTEDMLLLRSQAISLGFDGYFSNIGNMENKGIDFSVGVRAINNRNFKWDVDFIGSHFRNKVTKLNSDEQEIIVGQKIIKVGEPINSWYLPRTAGVDPDTGSQLYYYFDTEGVEQTTTSTGRANTNRAIVGSRLPDFTGSINNSLTFYGFDLSILCSFSVGGKEFNGVYQGLTNTRSAGNNWHKDLLNRWQEPGDATNVPRLVFGQDIILSDRFLFDASYLSIRNITLGYSLPQSLVSNIGLGNVRFFAVGDNIATLTSMKGMDPQNNLTGGQNFVYTPTKVFSLGIDIKF